MTDVAAFDFDGTLTHGGSVFGFLRAAAGTGPVVRSSTVLVPRLVRAALAGGTAADRTKERLFVAVLAGLPADRVADVGRHFARHHVAAHLRHDVRDRLDWHRRRGDRIVIVSASPEIYVGEAGRLLGVDEVIATHLEVGPDGRLTGRYEGANCRGEEKIRRLRDWIDGRPGEDGRGGDDPSATRGRLWAYGNSRGDLRMLAAADVGVNVGRLGRFGRLHGYPDLAGDPEDTTLPAR